MTRKFVRVCIGSIIGFVLMLCVQRFIYAVQHFADKITVLGVYVIETAFHAGLCTFVVTELAVSKCYVNNVSQETLYLGAH